MSYAKYPKEMKEAVVSRIMSGWRDAAQKKGLSATTKYKNADKWSSQDKFTVVLETANLSEIEFSEYCRQRNIRCK